MYNLDLDEVADILIELLPAHNELTFLVIESRLRTQH
jgi:hypothetical protein